jgi:iron(III) transport system substrate-binding protein
MSWHRDTDRITRSNRKASTMTRYRKGRMGSAVAALAVVALAGGLLAACGSSSSGATTHSITLYNGQHEQTTDSLVAGFEKATGIQVNVRDDDEDTLADEIVTEGSHSPADVIYTENTPAVQYLGEKGLLAKVDPSTLANTPSQYNSQTGQWVGVSARVSVLIYNPGLISKSALPTSVLQLSDPRYKGLLAFAAGETDFQPIVTSVARTYGDAAALKWLDGIKSNAGSHIYPDNETIADEVNRGAVAFGVVNQYYWYRMGAELGASNVKAQITYFAPHDPGYVLDVSPAAVLKSSTHQADAQRFLAFITSKQGQEIIAHSISFEYPIASGVSTSQPETPFDQLQPNSITIAQLGDGSTAIALLKKAGLL